MILDLLTPLISNVCPDAPAGIDAYTNMIIGWVKYGVAAIILVSGFVSVGAMVVGKLGQMQRASSAGASGLFYCVLGAIAFVTIYGILWAIVNVGCGK